MRRGKERATKVVSYDQKPYMNNDVSTIRKGLQQLRLMWDVHSPENVMNLSQPVVGDRTAAEFAFNFVLNHHIKQSIKSKKLSKLTTSDQQPS